MVEVSPALYVSECVIEQTQLACGGWWVCLYVWRTIWEVGQGVQVHDSNTTTLKTV